MGQVLPAKANLNWWNKRLFIWALMIGLIYIIFSVGLGLYSTKLIPASSGTLAHYPYETHNHLNPLAKWDSVFYLNIAQHSYTEPVSAAFFPLYPMLIKVVAAVTGSALTAAIIVSWSCLIGAIYFYLQLLKLLFKKLTEQALSNYLFLFLLFPSAVFLIAAYSESLFALLSLSSIYFVLKNRPGWAFLLAGLSSITRINGLFVLLLVAILCFEKRLPLKQIALKSLSGIVPFGLFLIFLAHRFHNPLQFLQAEKMWGHFNGSYVSSLAHSLNLFNLIGLAGIVVAVYYWSRRRRLGFAAYSLLYLLTPFISGSFDGFNRYILMVFPLQWLLVELITKRPQLFTLTLAAFASLWGYFIIQYFGGYTGG